MIISQHSLPPFPGCFPGPFCYAVKALRACDHSDKTYHDDSAAKGSSLCKNKQAGLLCSRQSVPEPKLPRDKQGFPGTKAWVPDISCIATDTLHGRRKVTTCFAPRLPLLCKCKTGPEALHGGGGVYMEKDSKGLFQKTLSFFSRRIMTVPWSTKLLKPQFSSIC